MELMVKKSKEKSINAMKLATFKFLYSLNLSKLEKANSVDEALEIIFSVSPKYFTESDRKRFKRLFVADLKRQKIVNEKRVDYE